MPNIPNRIARRAYMKRNERKNSEKRTNGNLRMEMEFLVFDFLFLPIIIVVVVVVWTHLDVHDRKYRYIPIQVINYPFANRNNRKKQNS